MSVLSSSKSPLQCHRTRRTLHKLQARRGRMHRLREQTQKVSTAHHQKPASDASSKTIPSPDVYHFARTHGVMRVARPSGAIPQATNGVLSWSRPLVLAIRLCMLIRRPSLLYFVADAVLENGAKKTSTMPTPPQPPQTRQQPLPAANSLRAMPWTASRP